MTTRIRISEKAHRPMRDTSVCLPRVNAEEVAAALGAELDAEGLEGALAPITLLAVRQELVKRLQSNGGRPGLANTSRRAKIPLSEAQWCDLEVMAAAISSKGFAPSAGQVASVLLTLSVQSLASRTASLSNRSEVELLKARGPT